MRIMHISTRLILGGSQENTVLSCEGQASRGHDVALVFGPIYGPEGSLLERVKQFRAPAGESRGRSIDPPTGLLLAASSRPRRPETEGKKIEAIETPNLVRALSPIRDLRCRGDLRRIIRRWNPDVVHTHSSKAGILGRSAAWREHVPCVIHTVHGPPFHRYERWWRNRIYIASERFAAKRCHRIVCVADAMREQFLANRIGRPQQYVTIYSGMEVEQYLTPRWSREQVRRDLNLAPADFVAGTIARLAEHKGHDDLLDSLGPLMRARPNLKLLWVGDGWWRERLIARVESMGLRARVITTGLVPPEAIPRYLQAMDVLVHPSYREGLPRTVVQGLLAGLPAVAYDVDGTREVCIDGETGCLLAPGDRLALRGAIEWMIDHPAERAAMGARGRELCRTRFAAATMVEQLESIYAGVLDRVAGPGRDRDHVRG
jgi:glycosyltransferase involved in cell wall biosynthesis